MTCYDRIVRPVLFRADPEWIHDRSVRAAERLGAVRRVREAGDAHYAVRDPRLRVEAAGLQFRSPLGLAAGYDKNGRGVNLLSSLGFGHVEVGSVSAERSGGNPAPRLWRIPADRGIVVHYGVPNDGAEAVARRLPGCHTVPVGANLVNTNRGPGAAEESVSAIIADYARSVTLLQDRCDYLCLNLSCPNTRDGQGFFHQPGRLEQLLDTIGELNPVKPVFLKVAPFSGTAELDRFLETAGRVEFVSGFSVNLPPGKPDGLVTSGEALSAKPGAVSGPPCRARAEETVSALYRGSDPRRHVVIGSGGVSTAEDAYRMIRLGATLVQLFTALIYDGPGVVKRINLGLAGLLRRDGFATVADAVGADIAPAL